MKTVNPSSGRGALARAMSESEAGLFWFEEPVRAGDFAGLRHVRDR